MSVASTLRISRRTLRLAWLPIGGYLVAALDLMAAIAYWAPRGVAPIRVPQSIAAWLLGEDVAHAGGVATAVLGALFYAQVLWGVVALYHALARRYPVLHRKPMLCGGVYGALAYIVLFQVVAVLLTGTRGPMDASWIATCVAVYAFLVGIPCAWFSRLAATS